MPHFKTLLVTAALIAAPSIAFAQSSATNAKDFATDKAVDTVLENATGEDAIVAGTTVLKGGSKTDAAVAVVKNRANTKVENVAGDIGVGDLSTDGLVDSAKGSATGVSLGGVSTGTIASGVGAVSSGGVVDAAKGSATTYAKDKATGSATTYGSAPVIPKSGVTTTTAPAPTAATVNCPSGTTAQADGTCMITGDWGS